MQAPQTSQQRIEAMMHSRRKKTSHIMAGTPADKNQETQRAPTVKEKTLSSRRTSPRQSDKNMKAFLEISIMALIACNIAITLILYIASAQYFINFLLPTLLLIIITFLMVRYKKHVTTSFTISEGKIIRLQKDLNGAKLHTDIHNQQIKHLIESTNVCPWNADLQKNCFTYIGPQITNITGIGAEDWLRTNFLIEHIIPQDHKIMFAALRNLKKGGFTTIEYRVACAREKTIWLRNALSLTKAGDKVYLQGFLTDITEQKNIEHALRTARNSAENASKTKSNFLASMSHELRTPLNSIIGFSEIMKTEAFGPLGQPQYGEYACNIYDSGRHLLDLINDILDYSKIEAGKFEVIKDDVALKTIFYSCEVLLRERALRKGVGFNIMSPPDDLIVFVDSKRIKQVIINLLTNAIKFTPSGGKIYLEYNVIPETNKITLYIKDSGIGIRPEDLENICQKFHQVDAEKNRDQEGTGLGLAISKSLVEMHGGVLNIDSIYGHGTTLMIELPIR